LLPEWRECLPLINDIANSLHDRTRFSWFSWKFLFFPVFPAQTGGLQLPDTIANCPIRARKKSGAMARGHNPGFAEERHG
jgi:hypothetical protein